jgi:Transcriptional regulators
LYRLTNSFPYLLNRVGVQMGELFSRRIAGYGVTLPMYRVMAALWETGDQRLGDLAAMTTIEISTLSRLVGEMKRRGLVTRARLKDNGRTVAINLTPKGRTLVEELIPIAIRFEEVAGARFPVEEHFGPEDNSGRDLREPEVARTRDRGSQQGEQGGRTKA